MTYRFFSASNHTIIIFTMARGEEMNEKFIVGLGFIKRRNSLEVEKLFRKKNWFINCSEFYHSL